MTGYVLCSSRAIAPNQSCRKPAAIVEAKMKGVYKTALATTFLTAALAGTRFLKRKGRPHRPDNVRGRSDEGTSWSSTSSGLMRLDP
jgi:hypothetical protein